MKRPWVWLFVVVFLLYGLVTVLVFIPLVEQCYGETIQGARKTTP